MTITNLLDFDESGVSLDEALVDSSLEAEVALLSPGRAPRIADDPVLGVGRRVDSVAHDGHGVVNVSHVAGRIGKDTAPAFIVNNMTLHQSSDMAIIVVIIRIRVE